jgi:hypothetical protein
MMTDDYRLQESVCKKTGKRYLSTKDASGKHTLTVDAENVHLLRDVTWWVSPIRSGSAKLSARAGSSAPRIRKGRLLHRLVMKTRGRNRRVRALDGNLLNATKANLQSVSHSDMTILGKTRPADKLLGVQYLVPPKWLKTPFHYHSRIQIALLSDVCRVTLKTRAAATR